MPTLSELWVLIINPIVLYLINWDATKLQRSGRRINPGRITFLFSLLLIPLYFGGYISFLLSSFDYSDFYLASFLGFFAPILVAVLLYFSVRMWFVKKQSTATNNISNVYSSSRIFF